MATAPLKPRIPVDEYLKSTYHPDRDYVDGFVEERNLGELDHSDIQSNLVTFFRSRHRVTGIQAWVEWRCQTGPSRFRVPDVTVMRGKPAAQILTEPPLLCIEILSPEDRPSRIETKIQEYLNLGTLAVWVIDPREKTIRIHRQGGVEEASDPVGVDGTDLAVPFSEIFE